MGTLGKHWKLSEEKKKIRFKRIMQNSAYVNAIFKKGMIPWSKGKKRDDLRGDLNPSRRPEVIKKIIEIRRKNGSYKHTEYTKTKISNSLKNNTPWNKNKHNIYSVETLKRLSESSPWKGKFEKDCHFWKGDNVGYHGLHKWVQLHLGKPTKCEHCGKDGLTGNQIHWANEYHSYLRKKEGWLRLCSSCHKKYDKKYNF